ncbi:MAG: nuclease A inhibitor family protein [Polyangiales bacterium]
MFARVFAVLGLSLALGCVAEAPSPDADSSLEESDAVKTSETFFSLKRDLRKCAYPLCGGWYATSLEDDLAKCADGKPARSCYVSDLDLGALEPARDRIAVDGAIVAAHVTSKKHLVVAQAWSAPAPSVAKGSYFLVTAKNASSNWALRLGLSRRRSINGLDLGAAPGTDGDWDAVKAAANTANGPIVAGTIDSAKILEATQFWLPVTVKPAVCGAALDADIAAAAKDLYWPSESDYPVDVFDAKGASPLTTASFRALVGAPADALVEERAYASVLDPLSIEQDWMDDGQKATAAKFRAVRAVLEKNLTNLQVFRVGTISIKVYVIGKTACGTIAGVSSTVIET